jgi:two-component system response regulator FixJ
MDSTPIIHIIDDSHTIRKSLHRLLQAAHLEAITYKSAQDFLDHYESTDVGCILLDVRMPEVDGLELQQQLPERHIHLPVIFMTGYADVPTAIRAMKAGAFDFIEKPFDQGELLVRIRQAIRRSMELNQSAQNRENVPRMGSLTGREREVLKLLVNGNINKVIAAELGISTRTVEAHRAHIMEKLHARSLSDVIKMAIHWGL